MTNIVQVTAFPLGQRRMDSNCTRQLPLDFLLLVLIARPAVVGQVGNIVIYAKIAKDAVRAQLSA